MSELHSFDVAIIGSGPGGYSTALRAAEIGKSVLLVEKSDVPGGVCLHEGCVPSKALLTAAHIIRDSQRAEEMGLTITIKKLDIGKLIDYKENVVKPMTTGLEAFCASARLRRSPAWGAQRRSPVSSRKLTAATKLRNSR